MFHIIPIDVPAAGLAQDSYTVNEFEGSVNVCVTAFVDAVDGPLTFTVSLSSHDGTAVGESS